MNLGIRSHVAVLVLALCGTVIARAGDPPGVAPRQATSKARTGITFLEPEATTGTNSTDNSLLPKPTLDSLDQPIRKPFEIFRNDGSLDGMLAPPTRRLPPPPVRNKRAEAMRERKESWVFSTPEEIFGLPTPEDLLDVPEFGPDGELKAPKTAFERYLERTMQKDGNSNSTNQNANNPLPSWLKSEDHQNPGSADTDETKSGQTTPSFSPWSGNSAAELKTPAGNDFFAPLRGAATPTPTVSSETFFNFGGGGFSDKPAGKDTARELRMQEFKQLLEARPAAGAAWGSSGQSPLASPATVNPPSGVTYGASPFTTRPASPSAALPTIAPVTSPANYSTAPVTPASRSVAPLGSFELPKRKY